jgi:hypothetical protein
MTAHLDHSSATQGVLDAVSFIAASPQIEEAELVRLLQGLGYSAVQAEKLNAFVPSSFAWALLKRMGLASFPSHYIALAEHGREVSLPVAHEHYFTAALQLAYQTLEQGWSEQLSRAAFEAVISRSAEMAAANQLLSQGLSFAEATLQPLRVSRFSAEAANGS